MDVLSDVLDTVRLTSTVFVRTELAAPWGIRSRPREHFAFHVISRGHCWLDADGLAPTEVAAGDVVVLAPGRAHALRDDPESPAHDIEDLLAGDVLCQPRGGAAATTHLVCGWFRFEDTRGNLLLSALPALLHIRPQATDIGPWLTQTIDLLAYESFAGRPGNATVVNRLCDALFVYLLRSHLASLPDTESSWLRALDEPQIGAALRLMHEQPGRPWNVPTLASLVGMSRSAFAARFTELVGQTPIRYLTQWRLQRAAAMLRTTGASLDEVAIDVGYRSTIAFSKAFKQSIGLPPATYRRAAGSGR